MAYPPGKAPVAASRRARIMLSSVLPYKDSQPHIYACIAVSSKKKQEFAGKQMGAYLINNDLAFFTLTAQVKTGCMRDAIHPNNRGSSGLAVNIKRHYSAPRSTNTGAVSSTDPKVHTYVPLPRPPTINTRGRSLVTPRIHLEAGRAT